MRPQSSCASRTPSIYCRPSSPRPVLPACRFSSPPRCGQCHSGWQSIFYFSAEEGRKGGREGERERGREGGGSEGREGGAEQDQQIFQFSISVHSTRTPLLPPTASSPQTHSPATPPQHMHHPHPTHLPQPLDSTNLPCPLNPTNLAHPLNPINSAHPLTPCTHLLSRPLDPMNLPLPLDSTNPSFP